MLLPGFTCYLGLIAPLLLTQSEAITLPLGGLFRPSREVGIISKLLSFISFLYLFNYVYEPKTLQKR